MHCCLPTTSALENYEYFLKDNSKLPLNHYKKCVIAGVLTLSLGLMAIAQQNPTFHDIYQATRNPIKKNPFQDELPASENSAIIYTTDLVDQAIIEV